VAAAEKLVLGLTLSAEIVVGLGATGCTPRADLPHGGGYEQPSDNLCAGDKPRPPLEPDDCNELPDLRGMKHGSKRQIRALGDLGMPKEDRAAIDDAVTDATRRPLVHYVITDLGTKLDVAATNQSDWAGVRDGEIRLYLSATGDPADRRLPKNGSIAAALEHEGGHVIYDRWIENAGKSKTTHDNLVELDKLYAQDLTEATEAFRKTSGQAAMDEIHDFAKEFTGKDGADMDKVVEWLAEAFSKPRGLDAVSHGKDGIETVRRPIPYFIRYAARQVGVDMSKDAFKEIDKEQHLKEAERLYVAVLSKEFDMDDEGTMLNGLLGTVAGHPYDRLGEWVPSKFSTTSFNPERVVELIQQLPYKQSERKARELQLVHALLEENDPGLAEQLQLSSVLKRF
jgi:hypothetical protein